jgi:hypothetical protein
MNDTKPTNPKDALGSDKLPLHLWPATATILGSLGLLDGACKYGRSNFRAIGVRASIYVDAAKRHIDAWMEGEDTDPDSSVHHLGHALASLAIIVEAIAKKNLTDDRNYPTDYREWVNQYTPLVKQIKERYANKHPKHYTIQDGAKTSCASPQPAQEPVKDYYDLEAPGDNLMLDSRLRGLNTWRNTVPSAEYLAEKRHLAG